jgi:hypothetical protein
MHWCPPGMHGNMRMNSQSLKPVKSYVEWRELKQSRICYTRNSLVEWSEDVDWVTPDFVSTARTYFIMGIAET